MSHRDEYSTDMVAMLELLWGEGYMAPGGPGNVARMLRDIETRGKKILDIGSGLGGPALEMAATHGALVTGIDLEAPLIERASQAAAERGLDERCQFVRVAPGPLPFDDEAFDIVVSAGALTQTADALRLLEEALRVLVRGGHLSCYEWFKSPGDLSTEMREWIELEGLTYALRTQDEFRELMSSAGFLNAAVEDASAWYRKEAHRELDRMRGELYPQMVERLGREEADHFVANWEAMVIVLDRNEMRQGYCRALRPAT